MAVNLVSLIMQFLTPDMIGRIASALGLDRTNTQTAIGAAIPGLLAGLSGVAAQPGGAQKLVDTVGQQTGALGSFANMIGASGQSSLIEKGSQILSSLLGGRDQTALAGAVSKYAGLGQNASGSLLGMLAPIVMGTIGQQQGTRSLDAGGIASLLSSQKDNIAAALPAGFANLLGGSGLLDSLGGAARTATAAAGQTARVTTSAARAIGDTGQRAAAVSLNWLYWLIPLLAILAVLIYLFARPTEQVVVQPGAPAAACTKSFDAVETVGLSRLRCSGIVPPWRPTATASIATAGSRPWINRNIATSAPCGSTATTRAPRRLNEATRSPTWAPMSNTRSPGRTNAAWSRSMAARRRPSP